MSRYEVALAADRERRRAAYAPAIKRAQELRNTWVRGRQMSLAKVGAQLGAEGFKSPNGQDWTATGIRRLLALGAD